MSNKVDRPVNVLVETRILRRPLMLGAVFVMLGGVAGCSSVPDAVNPAEWYKSTVDFFAGEEGEEQAEAATEQQQAVPGEDKPFPNLSSVPSRPVTPVQNGLVADTENRKYAKPIARQGETTEMLAAQPPAPPPAPSPEPAKAPTVIAAPTQPKPPAMPVQQVAQAPAPAEPLNIQAIKPKEIILTPPASAQGLPANAMQPFAEDQYSTVVISSNGVVAGGASAAFAQPAAVKKPLQAAAGGAAMPMGKGRIEGTKIATILFGNGSSGLNAHDRRILKEVVKLHQRQGGKVTVVGHASSRTRDMDSVRHKMVNYRLSVNRAERIAAQLRRYGMNPDALVVDARSDTMPLYYETMPSGEAGNRRAEIYFQN